MPIVRDPPILAGRGIEIDRDYVPKTRLDAGTKDR
jgi:hypothetical protein